MLQKPRHSHDRAEYLPTQHLEMMQEWKGERGHSSLADLEAPPSLGKGDAGGLRQVLPQGE